VVDCYLEGRLPIVRAGDGSSGSGLPPEEAAVLRILSKRPARGAARRVKGGKAKLAA
jgi:hypothetical protein